MRGDVLSAGCPDLETDHVEFAWFHSIIRREGGFGVARLKSLDPHMYTLVRRPPSFLYEHMQAKSWPPVT